MGMSKAGKLLYASRFAEMLGMGMSQAGMLLHASRFAEMLGMDGYEVGGSAPSRFTRTVTTSF